MANVHTFAGSNTRTVLIPIGNNGDLNSTYNQPFVDFGAERAVYSIHVGEITADIDMALFQAQDSTGTGRKAITGAEITTLTSATGDRVRAIEIGPGAMDDNNGFTYVRAEVTVAGVATEYYEVELISHRLRRPGTITSATNDENVIVLG